MSKINEEWKHCYDELWEGRNIEIKNLWQRSVFLLTLLLASFYVYFGLWKTVIDKKTCQLTIINIIKNSAFNLVCINIAFFGLVFCYLWIRMGQGAKKNIEEYERSINELYEKSSSAKNAEVINIDIFKKYPHHGNLKEPYHMVEGFFKSIFSTSGAKYSVSRINIAIGQVVGVIWLEIIVLHFVFLVCSVVKCRKFDYLIFLLIIPCGFFTAYAVSYMYGIQETRYWIKSGGRKTVEVKFCGIFNGNLKLSETKDYVYIKYPRKRGYKNKIKIYTDKKGFSYDKIQIINGLFYLSIIKDCSNKEQGINFVDIIIKDPSGNVLTEEDLFGKKNKILDKDIEKIYIFEA